MNGRIRSASRPSPGMPGMGETVAHQDPVAGGQPSLSKALRAAANERGAPSDIRQPAAMPRRRN
jgi:hypothetical protein